MKCPYCNNEIPNKSKECEICGVSLETVNQLSSNSIYTPVDKIMAVVAFFTSMICAAFGITIIVTLTKLALVSFKPLLGFTIFGIGLVLYAASYFLIGLSNLTGKKKYEDISDLIMKISSYVFYGGFFLFWFGFLIVMDVSLIKEPDGMPMILFSLIFWAVGIFALVSAFRK